MRRWFLVPAVLFLGAGLINGGADLPGGWGLLVLGVPLALVLVQFSRPTKLGWCLAFGSFCLLILTTATLDLAVAVPRGVPPLSASAAIVVLFAVQFGVPAWLIWLAKPRGGHPSDCMPGLSSRLVGESGTSRGSTERNRQVKVPPNHPLQATAGGECSVLSSGPFARGARAGAFDFRGAKSDGEQLSGATGRRGP